MVVIVMVMAHAIGGQDEDGDESIVADVVDSLVRVFGGNDHLGGWCLHEERLGWRGKRREGNDRGRRGVVGFAEVHDALDAGELRSLGGGEGGFECGGLGEHFGGAGDDGIASGFEGGSLLATALEVGEEGVAAKDETGVAAVEEDSAVEVFKAEEGVVVVVRGLFDLVGDGEAFVLGGAVLGLEAGHGGFDGLEVGVEAVQLGLGDPGGAVAVEALGGHLGGHAGFGLLVLAEEFDVGQGVGASGVGGEGFGDVVEDQTVGGHGLEGAGVVEEAFGLALFREEDDGEIIFREEIGGVGFGEGLKVVHGGSGVVEAILGEACNGEGFGVVGVAGDDAFGGVERGLEFSGFVESDSGGGRRFPLAQGDVDLCCGHPAAAEFDAVLGEEFLILGERAFYCIGHGLVGEFGEELLVEIDNGGEVVGLLDKGGGAGPFGVGGFGGGDFGGEGGTDDIIRFDADLGAVVELNEGIVAAAEHGAGKSSTVFKYDEVGACGDGGSGCEQKEGGP